MAENIEKATFTVEVEFRTAGSRQLLLEDMRRAVKNIPQVVSSTVTLVWEKNVPAEKPDDEEPPSNFPDAWNKAERMF